MRSVIWVLIFVCLSPMILASTSIPLLSVSEGIGNRSGSTAEANLEVRLGSGSVYIDTQPLTRIDTQLSVRFARDYACMLAGLDCTRRDFFYQIRAPTILIGGPSAGAAFTVLTYAELTNTRIDPSVAVTGTINSGGMIGPVGGISEKVIAARLNGFTRVLVPALEFSSSSVISGIEVIPVWDIEEVIFYMTGKDVRMPQQEIIIPLEYHAQMAIVASDLCSRANTLRERTQSNSSDALIERGAIAADEQLFYSSASFCFGANLRLQEEFLSSRSQSALRGIVFQLQEDIIEFDASLPTTFSTITDLEVFMGVRERLLESQSQLESITLDNISPSTLAVAVERLSSARSWSSFFGVIPSPEITISERALMQGCSLKISEAQERVNYVQFLLDIPLDSIREDVGRSLQYQSGGEFALCIFSAAKAKASANSIIGAVMSGESINKTVEYKRNKAATLIGSRTQQEIFPILSYAYYEYSGQVDDIFSAHLYAEFALEFSMLDIYFPRSSSEFLIDTRMVFALGSGFLIGLMIGVLVLELVYARRRKK